MIKIPLIILFPFLLTAQNVWYVDRDTPQRDNPTGQNGRSWATAWQDLDSVGYWVDYCGVNWNIIQPGDTIYMSGGTDSTRYTPKDHAEGINIYGVTMVYSGNHSFAGGNPVIITKAWHPNHNGDVYFYTDDNIVATGTATSTQTNRLVDNTANFQPTLEGKRVWNIDSSKASWATVDTVVSTTILALSSHIIQSGEDYRILNQAQRAFDVAGVSNVKFVNLNFYNMQNPYYSTSSVVALGDASNSSNPDSLIQFDNCVFYTRGANAQLGMGSTKTTVRNCLFDMEESDFINDNDAMGFSGGLGGHIIDNNTFRFRNGDMVGGAHRDCLQWSNIGQSADVVTRYTTHISNNLVVDLTPEGIGWNAYVYSSGPYANQIFYIYNNIFVNRKEYSSPVSLFMYHPGTEEFDDWKQSYHILNNTFIMKGEGSGPITLLNSDTTIVKNNILVVDTVNTLFYSMDGTDGFPIAYKDLDYNLFAERYGLSASEFGFDNGNNRTYTYWTTTFGYDVNSDTMDARNLIFANKYDTTKAGYYVTSPIGTGTDLSATYPFLANDALGNARTSGGWLGALDNSYYSEGVDSMPDAFTYFEDITNTNLNTLVSAQTGDLLNFDSAWVSIDRGYYNINGLLPWKDSSQYTKVYPNDDVYLRDTSASTYSTSKSIVLTVGSRSQTWTHTTKSSDTLITKLVYLSDGKIAKASDYKILWAGVDTTTSSPDTTAPAPPTSLVATGQNTTDINIVWSNPADVDSIYLYEGTTSDTLLMSLIVRLGAVQSYLRTGLSAETTRWYAVKAVDASGNVSYFSNRDDGTTTASEGGTPLQNLKMAYLTQSTAAHLFDHSTVGNAGTTSVPLQVVAYNDANNLNGYDSVSVIRIDPDYPACGDMIWDWWAVYWNKDLFSCNAEYIVDDWLTDTTYSIVQVTFGSASGALYDYYGTIDTTATAANKYYGNNYRYFIRQMVYVMEQYPDKYFVLWTLMPPTVSYSDSTDLVRATQFCTWMTDTLATGNDSYGAFPNNVMIYDVHTLLDSSHYLPRSYADGDDDPHPNAAAASVFAPDFVSKVFNNARAYRRPD